MQPGFPKRKKIIDRGIPIDLGGDYRYRYDLCPYARTVVITDMNDDVGSFTPGSVASSSRVATINLTSGNIYHNIVFRPVNKEVWVFGTVNTIVIDANPASGSFNTIIATHAVGSAGENGSMVYNHMTDSFFRGSTVFNPQTLTYSTSPNIFGLAGHGSSGIYYNGGLAGDGNGNNIYISHLDGNNLLTALGSLMSTFIMIANKLYAYTGSTIVRYAPTNQGLVNEASISTAAIGGISDGCYSTIDKRLLMCSHGSGNVLVANISPTFSYAGNISGQLSGIAATNQSGLSYAMFNPYSQKAYIRSSRGGSGATTSGVDRYFIIDLSRNITDMVCGYRTIDVGSQVTGIVYQDTFACFNGLKLDSYE